MVSDVAVDISIEYSKQPRINEKVSYIIIILLGRQSQLQ
jgi:hypothetical protein